MELLQNVYQYISNLPQNLGPIINQFGYWTYGILFVTIFCETGLVITPFLPGDSLLFASGSIASVSSNILNVNIIVILLLVAAVLGDACNYWIGYFFGDRLFKPDARILKTAHLQKAHNFYERYGPKAVVISRFLPLFRTLVPFVAGMGGMDYKRFMLYNLIGAGLWVCLITYAGYFFGNIPFVQHNFALVILAIIIISLLPPIFEFIRVRYFSRNIES